MILFLRVFLDSNVLFSAAYRPTSDFTRIWDLPNVEVVVSPYVVEEVSRHLTSPEQRARLWKLLYRSHLVSDAGDVTLPEGLNLPAKDQPILKNAIAAGAQILVTGDENHFGHLFGQEILGVLIESPRDFKTRYPEVFQGIQKR